MLDTIARRLYNTRVGRGCLGKTWVIFLPEVQKVLDKIASVQWRRQARLKKTR